MPRIAAALVIAWGCFTAAAAQENVRIGVIGPFSGPFAVYGQQYQRGLELYLSEIGGKVGNAKIEVLYRDEGAGPEKVKQLAQELIVRERANMLGGLTFTPGALAIAPLITESRTPTLIFNAGTGSITRRSPYFVRTSQTAWQGAFTIGDWAGRNGIKSVYVLAADYAPGHDSRDAFKAAYSKSGGTIVGEVLYPPSTTDFAPYIRSITIDPQERDIIQNQYVRRVERIGNRLGNVAFETAEAVKDPWKLLNLH